MSEAGMDFGGALQAMRSGQRVARPGWNGKGMFVVLQKGYPEGIPINRNTSQATGLPEGTVCRFLPYLMMKTADGAFVPWLASQTDMLACDWISLDQAPETLGAPVRFTDRETVLLCMFLGRREPSDPEDAKLSHEAYQIWMKIKAARP